MSHPLIDRTVVKAFAALCWNVGTPVAYKALLALKREDWLWLVSMKVDIKGYRCPCTLSGDLQIAAFFKKYPGFDLGYDLSAKAIESFFEGEQACYRTNEFLSPLIFDSYHYGSKVHGFIREVRQRVKAVLGRVPSHDELNPRFGPGSTFSDIGPFITVPDKMSDRHTMTQSARPFLRVWDETAWSRYAASGLVDVPSKIGGSYVFDCPNLSTIYAPRDEAIVRGNRFTAVPKDAKKHRGICIEPSINLFYQLGVGDWLTMRMGRVLGWKKSGQQEYHKFLAAFGSVTRSNATIDLSNASDTICINLVKLLLPEDWYKLLASLRSPFTLVDGHWCKLEKFSSMGNGFTFELETILFDSIVRAVCQPKASGLYEDVVSTFGDDIICPIGQAQNVIAALNFFGFTTNKDKTFIDGGFRESCGGDFYNGADVRPHFLKESPCEPHQFIALANGLRRFGIRHILCGGPDVYRNPWTIVLKAIPSTIRSCCGPEHLGDQVIHDDEQWWRFTVRGSIRYFRVWRPVANARSGWHHFRPGVVLASALYGVGDGQPHRCLESGRLVKDSGGVLSRINGSYVSGYRFGRVSYS